MAEARTITRRSALLGGLLAAAAAVPTVAVAAKRTSPSDPAVDVLTAIAAEEARLDRLPGDEAGSIGVLGGLDRKLMRVRATTPRGAAMSLERARLEFMSFKHNDHFGDRLIVALIDSALNVVKGL